MTPARLREIAELLADDKAKPGETWYTAEARRAAANDLRAHANDLRAEHQGFAKASSLGVKFGRAGTAVRLVTSWELEA